MSTGFIERLVARGAGIGTVALSRNRFDEASGPLELEEPMSAVDAAPASQPAPATSASRPAPPARVDAPAVGAAPPVRTVAPAASLAIQRMPATAASSPPQEPATKPSAATEDIAQSTQPRPGTGTGPGSDAGPPPAPDVDPPRPDAVPSPPAMERRPNSPEERQPVAPSRIEPRPADQWTPVVGANPAGTETAVASSPAPDEPPAAAGVPAESPTLRASADAVAVVRPATVPPSHGSRSRRTAAASPVEAEVAAAGPSLEIGTIEIHLDAPAPPAGTPEPVPPSPAAGFDEYRAIRSYAR